MQLGGSKPSRCFLTTTTITITTTTTTFVLRNYCLKALFGPTVEEIKIETWE